MTQTVARSGRTATAGEPPPAAIGPVAGRLGLPLYLGFCALALLPFLLVATPPIVDFANHAARLHLACHAGDADVAAMYRFRWGLIPNLAVDLAGAPLCGIASPSLVLRLVTCGALAAVFAACWRLQRAATGGANVALLFVPATAMNLVTMTGYVNFLVGGAIALALLAELVARAHGRWRLLAIGNAAGVALFFAHVFALAWAMVAVFGRRMAGRRIGARTLAAAAAGTAAMFALPLAALPFVAREDGGGPIMLAAKARAVLAPFLTYSGASDILCLVLVATPILLLWRGGRLTLAPALRAPLAALLLYVAVAPPQLGTAVDIDARSAVLLAWTFVAALGTARIGWRTAAGIVALAAVPLAIHGATAATRWTAFAAEVAEARAAFAALPPGARLLGLYADAPSGARDTPVLPIAYAHLGSHATMDRHAFNPLDFTGRGMQPMQATPRFAAIDVGAGMPIPVALAGRLADPTPAQAAWARAHGAGYALHWPARFSHVALWRFRGADWRSPRLRPIARTRRLTLYRIVPAAAD